MERFVVDDLAFTLTTEAVNQKLKIEDEDDLALIDQIVRHVNAIAQPKAIYRVCYVEAIDGPRVTIDGTVFESDVLARNLQGLHRIFAYVCTCGTEVDDWSQQETDMVVRVWLDYIKEMVLHEGRQQFKQRLLDTYGIPKLSSMSPGSGNADVWPLAQQVPLFAMIDDVPASIGVTLTPSLLMVPSKSVSGIFFQADSEFITCSLCQRENCPGRRAPCEIHV